MNCADFEVLLCDYLDGVLEPVQRQSLEDHIRECGSCTEFFRDVTGAVKFVRDVGEVEPPAELLTRITFEIPSGSQSPSSWRSFFGGWLQPVLQPRLAMGMAMTILSFSMLGRLAGIEVRQLEPADLHPAKVWAAADDRFHRTWARAVKYYENLRLVYEVQTRLAEWTQQEQDEERKGRTAVQPKSDVPSTAKEGKEKK